jgi:hypothetical protein
MDRTKIIQVLVAVVMLVAIVYGRKVSFPDNVHVLHGFPLVWGTHQLVTIAGPVDFWYVNTVNLIVDLVFWVGLILITPYLTSYLKK